jgi:2-keto-4-pentenoate hydratase
MADGDRVAIAERLRSAERDATPIAPLAAEFPSMDVVDAYAIQQHNIASRVAAGATVRGHKVGLSSKAMQRMMGVDEPDYGHLLSDMFVYENTAIATACMCAPRVEVEMAFVLAQDLPAPGCTVADVLRCTAFVCPSLEIIDSRIADWRIGLVDTIADNASSALVVLGAAATSPMGLDPRTVGAVLRKNGAVLATGATGAVLGNPVTAVAWLANKVHGFGVTLGAGQVVLPGSCTRAFDASPGDVFRADFHELGSVSVRFS